LDLEGFRWSNPLKKLQKEKENSACPAFYNIYLDYEDYLVFLAIIWDRLREDYRKFNEYSDFHDKISEKAKSLPEWSLYRLSPDEVQESFNLNHWESKLMLDYESFIIFSRILMDKLAKVAQCVINAGQNSIPTESFTHHKKFFLKSENIPFTLNEKYAKIIREETEWYDLSLAAIRDKIVAHGNARMRSIPYYLRELRNIRPYTRPTKMVRLISFTEENDKIIEIKKKYEPGYPDLKNIFNLWEVLDYFLCNNVKLSKQDKSDVIQIISSTGARLPDLHVLANNIQKFLHGFYEALR
jgi:hypothetical protein